MVKARWNLTGAAAVEMIAAQQVKKVNCSSCGKTQNIRKRLPRGWKRRGDEFYCATCWHERYVLRAVTFQVASPGEGATWKEFGGVLHRMWEQTTSCSNWMVNQLALVDARRLPGDKKMPPMPRTYLYPDARKLFPELPPQTVASLEQALTRIYCARRYEVLWTCRAALPTFRNPQPFPVPHQSWSAYYGAGRTGKQPIISVRIGDRKFQLRLRNYAQYRRQLRAFAQIVAGDAVPCELALYRRRDCLLCKIVAWIPRPAAENRREGVLLVRTANDALLIALNTRDERTWTYNADHVPRWVAEHYERLHRWSEDTKAEQGPVPSFAARRQAAAMKYHNRMRTAAYQAAANVAGYARRRRFTTISYDDRVKSWCPEFPWQILRSRLSVLLGEYGMRFEIVSANGQVKDKDPTRSRRGIV